MTKQQSTRKTSKKADRARDVAGQLEQAFLAGLGALSNAQEAGGEAFQTLIKQGKSFRKEATDKTESLISEVQDAIRDMGSDAQTRATGLLEQMRETPQLEKIQSVFDARVAGALERIGVASKQSLDDLNAKLDRVLKAVEKEKSARTKATRKAPAAKAKPRKKAARKTTRKVAKKTAAKKTAAKKSAGKKTAGKTAKKATSRKKPARRVARKVSKKSD